jgi:isoleucyl-tRNA synthetase
MPLVTERIYTALTGEKSVHLTDWPDAATLPEDAELLHRMDLARDVCSGVMTLRETHRRRTRLPLQSLIVAHPSAQQLDRLAGLIAEAVNVKSVTFTADVGRYGTKEIKVNPKLGARLGAKFKDVLAAQRANQWTQLPDGRVEIAGVVLEAADSEIRIKSAPNVVAEPIDAWRGVVVLDITVYPELRSEGWARDFVRLVQQARKEADFDITDRITVTARGAPQLIEALEKHAAYVAGETLALKVDLAAGGNDAAQGHKDDIDGLAIAYRVERVAQRTEDATQAAG